MILGIDFDGVISDTEVVMRKMALKYIKKNLLHVRMLDKNEEKLSKRFSWSPEELLAFSKKATINATQQAKFIKGAKKYLTKLRNNGCRLFINTSRGQQNNIFNDLDVFYDKLEKFDFKFDKIICGGTDKVKECLDNKIEIMIDDRISICEKLAQNGIKCIYLNRLNFPKINNPNVIEVKNWKQIYKEISNIIKMV